MTIIVPATGSATSGMLDIWQAHIQQQQAQTAQTGANASSNASNDTTPQSDGDKVLSSLRSVSEGARQAGKAMTSAASDTGSAGNSVVQEAIRKLKEMLARVLAQLEAVRNNDRLPPQEKLQQVGALSAEAMAIQAQITALMDPTWTTGTRISTTA
ncbi:hypothetical protein AB870_18610 [Pandoraea faecigallinarum]|uniref:Uncharacterized protein n=1 Tax=Pandoraea faecigallinarum TaxID=656179 RepID=A0A0H3WVE4_9BURK|nr:hypothetical protein [Pandoraea faecigallinarum]AKM31702.1 hypothetical protein AB870_18610 [Pandoraea faecigallinarum]